MDLGNVFRTPVLCAAVRLSIMSEPTPVGRVPKVARNVSELGYFRSRLGDHMVLKHTRRHFIDPRKACYLVVGS